MAEEYSKQPAPSWVATVVRFLLIAIPAIASTIATFMASQATYQVYQSEQVRMRHDRLRHVSEIYREYSKHSQMHRPCMKALLDDTLLTPAEFRALLVTPEIFDFSASKHGRLADCAPKPMSSGNLSKEALDVRGITQQVSDSLTALDSFLLSYKYQIGDRSIICEIVRGYLEPHDQLVLNFLQRLVDLRMLNDDNFPNINNFLNDYRNASNKCPEYYIPTITFLDFMKSVTIGKIWPGHAANAP